jgi:Glycosyltransferase (GlcNAc)
MKEIHRSIHVKSFTNEEAPYGWIFLGRDVDHWGEEGTGKVTVDPDNECEQGCPHYNDIIHDALNDKIHLNIAAFCDCLCPYTLYNIFHKAKNPKRIYVRLIQQRDFSSNLEDDKDCWIRFCEDYSKLPCEEFKHQIQVLTMTEDL